MVLLIYLVRPGGSGFLQVPITQGPAPEWSMSDLDGNPVSSKEFNDQIVVLNFWATWCPPCVKELPDLQAFHTKYQEEGVVVIGASVDTLEAEVVRRFTQSKGLTYPILTADESVQKLFGGVQSIPTTFIVDREGNFSARYIGAITQAELTKAVVPLLTKQPRPEPDTK